MINVQLILHADVPGELFLSIDSIGAKHQGDVYYFAIDNSFMPKEETDEKVMMGLQNLFVYWKEEIVKLSHGNLIYLPFDYSDEYIGCLSVRCLESDNLMISYGYTFDIYGYSINPSNPQAFVITQEQFHTDGEFETCSKSELLIDMDRIVGKLQYQLIEYQST